jgi:hypothetical protein
MNPRTRLVISSLAGVKIKCTHHTLPYLLLTLPTPCIIAVKEEISVPIKGWESKMGDVSYPALLLVTLPTIACRQACSQ